MSSVKIISLFLGVALVIIIFAFNRAGIMEGNNQFLAAIQQQQTEATFNLEKQVLLKSIDTALASIENEVIKLISLKTQNNKDGIDSQLLDEHIGILKERKCYLMDKKKEIDNAYFNLWNGIKEETNSLLQSPEISYEIVQNS